VSSRIRALISGAAYKKIRGLLMLMPNYVHRCTYKCPLSQALIGFTKSGGYTFFKKETCPN